MRGSAVWPLIYWHATRLEPDSFHVKHPSANILSLFHVNHPPATAPRFT